MAAVAFAAAGLAFRSWGAAMLLPLTIAGFALLHARARHRRQGSFWMSGIYVAWLVFDAAKLGLVGLVLADTVMNFRDRWKDAESQAPDEGSDTEEQDVSDDDHQDDTKD
jgi:hypothetical protein